MRKNPTYTLLAVGLVLCLPTTLAGKPPPTATVQVDCTDPNPEKHDSVNEALEVRAEELTIEISGMCYEKVLIERNAVTVRGGDPAVDGIHAVDVNSVVVTIAGALKVDLENLTLTGGDQGVDAYGGAILGITNCRLDGNSRRGLKLAGATAVLFNSSMSSNGGTGAFLFSSSWLNCYTCTVADNASKGMEVTMASRAFLDDTHLSGSASGIEAYSASTAIVRNGSTIDASSTAVLAEGASTFYVSSPPTFSGRVLSWNGSHVGLSNTVQLSNPGGNVSTGDAFIGVDSGSVLVGDTYIRRFARVSIAADAEVDGNLICDSGGDAHCDDPSKVTGSTCSQCPKP